MIHPPSAPLAAAAVVFGSRPPARLLQTKNIPKELISARYGKNGVWHMGKMGWREKKHKHLKKNRISANIWEERGVRYGQNGCGREREKKE